MIIMGYAIEFIIRCLSTHFLFALFSGLLGYCLMWTISSKVYTVRSTFHSPFWAGVFCALLSHLILDTYTLIA